MTKSINLSILDPKYTEALDNLWKAATDLMTYSSNPVAEIYRVSSIVRLFAKQKAKIDSLRETLNEGIKKNDLYTINSVKFRAERMQEAKTGEKFWDKVSSEYDQMVDMLVKQMNNEDILISLPTSEDILLQCQADIDDDKKAKFDMAAKEAAALVNL